MTQRLAEKSVRQSRTAASFDASTKKVNNAKAGFIRNRIYRVDIDSQSIFSIVISNVGVWKELHPQLFCLFFIYI